MTKDDKDPRIDAILAQMRDVFPHVWHENDHSRSWHVGGGETDFTPPIGKNGPHWFFASDCADRKDRTRVSTVNIDLDVGMTAKDWVDLGVMWESHSLRGVVAVAERQPPKGA